MDNTCYFLGDTIYYKAYVTRSDTHKLTNVSKVLYVELFNQDGYLVERQILQLNDGQAHGSFCLEDTLYAGYHEIRAYTRWQLNWGEYEHPHSSYTEKWFLSKDMAKEFYRDYEKLYSRVFPVYDKPAVPGEYLHDMTLRPLRRVYDTEDKPKANVVFFPEGGAWIEGVEQELAFEANTQEGEHLDGKLTIYDNQDKMVAEAQTEHRGRGSIRLNKQADAKLHAEFTWGEGKKEKVNLPQAEPQGVAMHVASGTDGLRINIQRKNMDEELGICISIKGILQHYQAVSANKILIPTKDMPSGVAQITLYNKEGKVVADRMAFVRNADVQPNNVTFKDIPETCTPFKQVKIGVSAPEQATISVAVRDQGTSDYINDDSSILTELLLCSQIKGFVEQPGYYFEENDEQHRRHLDLLLMVQGWRRYRWENMTSKFVMRQPFEQHRILSGEVYKYDPLDQEDIIHHVEMTPLEAENAKWDTKGSAGPRLLESVWLAEDDVNADSTVSDIEARGSEKNVYMGRYAMLQEMNITQEGMRFKILYNSSRNDPAEIQYASQVKDNVLLHAEFTQPKQEGVVGDMVVENGKFSIDIPNFQSYCYFFLSAAKERKKSVKEWIVPDADLYPEYYVRLSNFYPRFVKPYSFYQSQLAPMTARSLQTIESNSFRETNLNEVDVKAKRRGLASFNINKPALVVDAIDAFNLLSDAGLCPAWYSGSMAFSLQFARMMVGDMGIDRSYDLDLRWNGKPTGPQSDATLMLYNHLTNLEKIQLFTDYSPRQEGFSDFKGSNQPTVTVNLCRFEDDAIRGTWRDRRYILPGYNVCEDFYQPNYSKKPLPTTKDYRRTLYWNPNLQLDKNGRAEVVFYNNGKNTQITVSAEGISAEGTPMTGLSMPEDR